MSRVSVVPRLTQRRRIVRALNRLILMHGPRAWKSDGPCLDVLIYCMLAQNTNMANARSGYRQLRRQFRTWREAMLADVRDVERQIAVCGLARMRARRMQILLRTIHEQRGSLSLQFLAHETPQVAYEYLGSFHGIGPKTAASTLLFALGVPMFPVDNGILRVARRLRFVRAKARDEETSRTIERHAPPSRIYPLHVLMFTHAKSICRVKNPKCDECLLLEMCPYGKRRMRHRPAESIEEASPRLRRIILSRRASDGIGKQDSEHDRSES